MKYECDFTCLKDIAKTILRFYTIIYFFERFSICVTLNFLSLKVVVLSPGLYPFITTAAHYSGDRFSMINTVVGVLNIFCIFC